MVENGLQQKEKKNIREKKRGIRNKGQGHKREKSEKNKVIENKVRRIMNFQKDARE